MELEANLSVINLDSFKTIFLINYTVRSNRVRLYTGVTHLHSRSLFLDAYDDSEFGVFLCLQHSQSRHREKNSLRHFAIVTKVLDDNKPKTSLKKWIRTASNFIDLIQFHLIWQMLAKFSRVESERTVSKFRRGKRQLLCCVHLLHKASVWN